LVFGNNLSVCRSLHGVREAHGIYINRSGRKAKDVNRFRHEMVLQIQHILLGMDGLDFLARVWRITLV
jgi:hypothetical protein